MAESLDEYSANIRNLLSDAARNYEWGEVFHLLSQNRNLINVSRLGGRSLYSPLHQAAYGGASIAVAKQLIDIGAWRTLQNARGERPIDVANRRGHNHLLQTLTPSYKHDVPMGVMLIIQRYFHGLIRSRMGQEFPNHRLRLPELEPMLELDCPKMWFPVPGMYGGFSYWLESTGVCARLISESWSRIIGGSGQRHLITSAGIKLLEEGFV